MEIFKNKFLLKLIASVCLFLTLFNFGVTNTVYADDGLGGVLLKPIVHLITAVGDGIINILHRVIASQKDTLLKIRGYTAWEAFWRGLAVVVVTIIAVVVVAVVCYFTAGLGAIAAAWITGTAVTVTSAMVTAAVIGRNNGGYCCGLCCIFRIFSR